MKKLLAVLCVAALLVTAVPAFANPSIQGLEIKNIEAEITADDVSEETQEKLDSGWTVQAVPITEDTIEKLYSNKAVREVITAVNINTDPEQSVTVADVAEKLETDQRRLRAQLFDEADDLRRTLHVDDQIVDIRADLIAREVLRMLRILGTQKLIQCRYLMHHVIAHRHGVDDCIDLFFRQDFFDALLQIHDAADLYWLDLVAFRPDRAFAVQIIDLLDLFFRRKGSAYRKTKTSGRGICDGPDIIDPLACAARCDHDFHSFCITPSTGFIACQPIIKLYGLPPAVSRFCLP